MNEFATKNERFIAVFYKFMVEEEDRFGRKQWKYLDKVNERDAKKKEDKRSKFYKRMTLKGIEIFVLKRDILCFITWRGL